MNYTVYDPATGQISHVLSTTDPDQAQINLQGKSYVEGEFSAKDHYIHNGEVVPIPLDPSTPFCPHKFDYATKTWQLDLELAKRQARQQRDSMLSTVDQINPVWWSTLSAQQQQDIVAYRQHLLDVPQQAGFPTEVEWPSKPHWL